MGNYPGKLLELLGVTQDSRGHFLHVRILSENNTEILWGIDEYTARNLQLITDFDSNFKYRLSFANSWNTTKSQYSSILSQTYLNQTKKISFLCSQDYINKLQFVKQNQISGNIGTDFIEPINTAIIPTYKAPKYKLQEESRLPFTLKSALSFSVVILVLLVVFIPIGLKQLGDKQNLSTRPVQLTQAPTTEDDTTSNVIKDLVVVDDKVVSDTVTDDKVSASETVDEIVADNKVKDNEIKLKYPDPITYWLPKGKVALTFEGGPTKYSGDVMNVLNKYKVGGTFFFTGANVSKFPNDVKNIHSNGYSIGSHSLNELYLPGLSYETQEYELLESNKVIESVINDKIVLFRPPYGAFNEDTEKLVDKHKYNMILWNNDPEDWKTHDSDKIFNHIKNTNTSGAIIILHETKAVLNALPKIIEHLESLELEIVNL